jgi:hypothetical protein
VDEIPPKPAGPRSDPPAPAEHRPAPSNDRIPQDKRERFREVAALVEQFGQAHLDEELTGYVHELWRRICRRKTLDCRRGQARIWAASVVHVIARMNFLFDRTQSVHLTFDTICAAFQTSKTTVGGKATEIARALGLSPLGEPGLCRKELIDSFTMVRLSNGMVVPLKMAKEMGLVPPDAMPR